MEKKQRGSEILELLNSDINADYKHFSFMNFMNFFVALPAVHHVLPSLIACWIVNLRGWLFSPLGSDLWWWCII